MKIKLNSDQEVVDTIREGLKRTSGYCPCRVERTEKNAGTLKVGKINVDEQADGAGHALSGVQHPDAGGIQGRQGRGEVGGLPA